MRQFERRMSQLRHWLHDRAPPLSKADGECRKDGKEAIGVNRG